MMHAYLFIGSSNEVRLQKIQQLLTNWELTAIDIVTLTGEHIGIDEVRSFSKQLLLKPIQSKFHIGIIREASSLTIEAQNALLKLLEEPPSRVRILLETDAADMLLPTIVSRCEIVHVVGKNTVIDIPLLKLMDAPIGEKLIMLEEYAKDRVRAKTFVADALRTGEKLLQNGKETLKIALILRRLQKAQAQLAVNCNPKLVLDKVFIQPLS